MCLQQSSITVSDKVVRCDKDTTAFLRISVYMTYNSETEDTQTGPCPYILQHSNCSSGIYYFRLPKHTSNLTSFMCGPHHRKGLLCGECEDGFGPALYSCTLECKRCWGHGLGWLLYISLTVTPIKVYTSLLLFSVSVSPLYH